MLGGDLATMPGFPTSVLPRPMRGKLVWGL